MYEIHNREDLIEAISKHIEFYNYHRYWSRFNSKIPVGVREEALNEEMTEQYPIAFNLGTVTYKESLKSQAQSA